MKKRITAWVLLIIATTITVFAVKAAGEDLQLTTVIGAYGAALIGLAAAKIVKDDFLYYAILVFIFFASPVGSVINLYRKVGPYDKIVHFASGILIASAGAVLVIYLLKKAGVSKEQLSKYKAVIVVFSFLAASASAGIWEIFEFLADKISGSGMQRGMVDTLTDMIAGNLGGIIYCLFEMIRKREK